VRVEADSVYESVISGKSMANIYTKPDEEEK
jgi:hypothetical protein